MNNCKSHKLIQFPKKLDKLKWYNCDPFHKGDLNYIPLLLRYRPVKLISEVLFWIIFIAQIVSCRQDLEKSPSSQLKSDLEDWRSGVISCPTTNCTQINCFCLQANCCNRQDLDPCDYSDMGAYAAAVATELCKATTGCIQKGFPFGCVKKESKCYEFSFLPTHLFSEDPNANPFHFCSSASCGTFYCDGIGAPFLHRPLSIDLQDQIADHILYLQDFLRPDCDPEQFGSNCQARFGDIHFSVCTDPLSGCENLGTPCWDTQIIITFEYWCCPCNNCF